MFIELSERIFCDVDLIVLKLRGGAKFYCTNTSDNTKLTFKFPVMIIFSALPSSLLAIRWSKNLYK